MPFLKGDPSTHSLALQDQRLRSFKQVCFLGAVCSLRVSGFGMIWGKPLEGGAFDAAER